MIHQKILLALMVSSCLYHSTAYADRLAETAVASLQDESSDPIKLPVIVVIGEKSTRHKFETGTSIEVNDAEQIKHSNHTINASDLLQNTANVIDTGTGNDLPSIRGVDGSGPATGAVAFVGGTRPRLNMSVDGRTSTYNEFAFGTQSLWDVQQVEVYRGPQSVMQGRNAIAGAVVITTKDPGFEYESALKIAAGNQDYLQLAAMISAPIIENELAFRLSVDRQERESFVDLISYDPVGDPSKFETTTIRGKLLYTPVDIPELTTKLTMNHIDSRAPQTEAHTNPNSARYSPQRPVFETESLSTIWDTQWVFNDYVTLDNKIIYTDYNNDRLSLPAPAGVPATLDGKEFQIEPILRLSSANEQWKGLVGLRYFKGDQDETVDLLGVHNIFKDKSETKAILGEVSYLPNEFYEITLSGRFENESHRRDGGSTSISIDRDKSYHEFLPKIDIAWKPSFNHVLGSKVARGYNPGGAGVTFASPVVSYSYEAEYLWNYELYHRYRNDSETFELATNIFLNDYEDMQLPYYLSASSVTIRNAEKVKTYGAEFNLNWMPLDGLKVYAALGLLKTKIEKYPNSNIEGNHLSRSPDYTLTAGVNYISAQGWEIGGSFRLTDDYYSNYQNNAIGKIDGYHEFNLQAAYNFKKARLSLFANNVFDADNKIFVPASDRVESVDLRPRLVGVALDLHFK